MSLARNKQRTTALSAIEIDSPAPEALIIELEQTPGITEVRALALWRGDAVTCGDAMTR